MKKQQQFKSTPSSKRELTAEEIKAVSGAGRWGGGALAFSFSSSSAHASAFGYTVQGRWGGGHA